MTFRRLLIAVDSEPIAVRAVDAGAELANALRAEIALVNVVESYPGDTGGVPPSELIALAKQDAKKLITDLRRHLSAESVVFEFKPQAPHP